MPDFIEVGPAKFQRVYSYTTKQRLPPCDGVILGRVSRPPRRSASRSPKLFKLPPMQSLNDAAYWHGLCQSVMSALGSLSVRSGP